MSFNARVLQETIYVVQMRVSINPPKPSLSIVSPAEHPRQPTPRPRRLTQTAFLSHRYRILRRQTHAHVLSRRPLPIPPFVLGRELLYAVLPHPPPCVPASTRDIQRLAHQDKDGDTHCASFSKRTYSSCPSAPYTAPASLYSAAHPWRSISRPTDLPLTSHPGRKRGFRYVAATYECT